MSAVPGDRATGRQRVLIALVATLAVIAFVESYQGLYHAAAAGHRPMPWLWPCVVEGFTLAMNVTIWDARSHGRRTPWAWCLLILATAVSTALQVLDVFASGPAAKPEARPDSGLGVLTAAWTPIALLLSFERWMWLAYGGNRDQQADDAQPAEQPAYAKPTAVAALERSKSQPAPRSPRSRSPRPTSTRGKVRQHLEQQRAAGAERPSTSELMRVAVERFGATRGGALRDLVLDAWPEADAEAAPAGPDGTEDPAA